MNSTELIKEIKNQLELLKHKGYDKNSFKSGYLLGYAKALQLQQTDFIADVGKSLHEDFTNITAAYSTRKLHSSVNHKCTCHKPDGIKDGGYCYAQDKLCNYRKPCELGMTIQDVLNGADIIG